MFTTAVADTSCLSSKTQTKKMHFGSIVFLIRDLRFTLQVVCIPLCSPIYVSFLHLIILLVMSYWYKTFSFHTSFLANS